MERSNLNSRERILSALNLREVDRPPIWFMRQAGRYLPEYLQISSKYDFWLRVKDSDLCTEISLQPLKRFDLDAAIVFSDILTPFPALGYEVEYGGGIRISPFEFSDLEQWPVFDAEEDAPWAANALQKLRKALPDTALLGFAGAPWTLAMYLLAGGTGDRDFTNARAKLASNPQQRDLLLSKLADAVADLLVDQALRGGADAVQIFATWAGLLTKNEYETIVLPSTLRVIKRFRQKAGNDIPIIHYARGAMHLEEALFSLPVNCISLDWRMELTHIRQQYGKKYCIQGNLDPMALHATPCEAKLRSEEVLRAAGNSPGFIFNLGHGISPGANIDAVNAMVETVTGGGDDSD
nr:uroporphyrinogen decarboxylase [Euryarchaeota archaeon]